MALMLCGLLSSVVVADDGAAPSVDVVTPDYFCDTGRGVVLKGTTGQVVNFKATGGAPHLPEGDDWVKDGEEYYHWDVQEGDGTELVFQEGSEFDGEEGNLSRATDGRLAANVVKRQKWKRSCESKEMDSDPFVVEFKIQKPDKSDDINPVNHEYGTRPSTGTPVQGMLFTMNIWDTEGENLCLTDDDMDNFKLHETAKVSQSAIILKRAGSADYTVQGSQTGSIPKWQLMEVYPDVNSGGVAKGDFICIDIIGRMSIDVVAAAAPDGSTGHITLSSTEHTYALDDGNGNKFELSTDTPKRTAVLVVKKTAGTWDLDSANCSASNG